MKFAENERFLSFKVKLFVIGQKKQTWLDQSQTKNTAVIYANNPHVENWKKGICTTFSEFLRNLILKFNLYWNSIIWYLKIVFTFFFGLNV